MHETPSAAMPSATPQPDITAPPSAIYDRNFDPDNTAGHCPIHGAFTKRQFMTFCIKCADDAATERKNFRISEAAREGNESRKGAVAILRNRASVPPRYANATLSHLHRDTPEKSKIAGQIENFTQAIINNKPHGGLIFTGNIGAGKTYAACAIINHLLENNIGAKYVTTTEMMRAIKQTFGRKDSDESDALAKFTDPKLLVIDEVAANIDSDFERRIFFEIIDMRYRKSLPTALITNLSLDEIIRFLGNKIIDRIRENNGKSLVFAWESLRRGA